MVSEALAPPVQADGRTSNKGAVLRAWVRLLRREGLFEPVRARVVPEVARLLDAPPSGSAWVDLAHLDHVILALIAEVGDARAEQLQREAMREGFSVVIETFVRAIIRLFHASPHAVFSRFGQVVEAQARGMVSTYEPAGDFAGTIVSELQYRSEVPPHAARAACIAAELVLELCDVRGTVSAPTVERTPGNGCKVSVTVRWEPRKR